ncbi:MAG: hypothetical protein PVG27_07810 [Chloroflexota bacterium]
MTGWQIVFGVVLIAHGIGHTLGVIPLFLKVPESWNTRSWLLSGRVDDGLVTAIAVVLWLACVAGFALAGLGVLDLIVPTSWWRPLAVGFSVLSLVTLGLFWQGFPVLIPNKVGAIAVDVALIVGIVVASWPTEEMVGS